MVHFTLVRKSLELYNIVFKPLYFVLGAGSIAAPIITALGRRPDAVLGKPAQNMLEAIYAE
jgi:ribonucleotide monophosphatase NagD (HAD superfamily)